MTDNLRRASGVMKQERTGRGQVNFKGCGQKFSLVRNDRSCILSLFLVLLALYLAFAGDRYGGLPVSDEEVMFHTTRAVVEKFSLGALVTRNSLRPELPKAYQGQEAKYGPGQSLAALPLYLVGLGLIRLSPAEVSPGAILFPLACATNALICAAVGVMFFVVARRLRYGRRGAIAGALVVGTATVVAPYAKSFFSEPLVALSLLGAVGALAVPDNAAPRRWAGVRAGAWLALAVLARVDNLILVPVFVAALWLGVGQEGHRAARRASGRFLLPILLAAVFIPYANVLRSGLYSGGGYAGEGFSTPFLAGLFGLLFSPSHGVLWYSPPVLVAAFYATRFHRRHPRTCFVVFAIVALKFLLYAKWWNWFGGWSWGSRFLLPVVPLVMLGLLEALSCWTRLRRFERALIAAAVVIGVAVQVSALLVAPNAYHGNTQFLAGSVIHAATGLPQPIADREQLLVYSPTQSPLVGNWTLIANGQIDWFGRRFAQFFPPWLLPVILTILGVMLAVGAVLLVRIWRGERRDVMSEADGAPCREETGSPLSDKPPELPAVVRRAALVLVILNVAVFVAMAAAMRGNGLWREDRDVYREGPGSVRSSRVSSVFLQDDFEVPPGLQSKTTSWQGYIEIPNWGEYTFHAVVWGTLDLQIGSNTVLHNPPEAAAGRRSIRAEVVLRRGTHPLRLTYGAPVPASPSPGARAPRLVHLYWTVPGGGEYQQIVGRSWFYPTRPGPLRRLIALLWRVKMGLPIVSILALWWIWIHASLRAGSARKTEESEVAQAASP